ncbi:MAG: phosphatidate cytidylyltransferase, partial [Pseudomonadota bacterium]
MSAGDQAGPSSAGKFGDLKIRLLSAVIVGAIALAGILLGGIWTALLIVVAVVAMTLELRSIVFHGGGPAGRSAAGYVLAVAAGALACAFAGPLIGLGVLAGLVAVSAIFEQESGGRGARRFGVLGAFYIGAAGIAFVALRGEEPYGLLSIIWAAIVVIAADVGGYFAGRVIGGPKLWPAVSPKKT